jgi:hypothetical protein
MKRFVVMLLVLLISSCATLSDVPVRADASSEFDDRLAGVWVGNDDTDYVYLHVGKVNGSSRVFMIEHNENREISSDEFSFVTACLPNGCFLSILIESKNDPGYLLFKYDVPSSGILILQHADEKFLRTAIASGLIRGEYHDKAFIPNADLHATESELRDFISKYGDQLFTGEKFYFSRQR